MQQFWITLGRAVLVPAFLREIHDRADYAFTATPSRPGLDQNKAMQKFMFDQGLTLTRREIWALHRVFSDWVKTIGDPTMYDMVTQLHPKTGDLPNFSKDDATCAVIGLACIDKELMHLLAGKSREDVNTGGDSVAKLSDVLAGGAKGARSFHVPSFSVAEPECVKELRDFFANSEVETALHEISAMRWWMRQNPCGMGHTFDQANYIVVLSNDELGLVEDPALRKSIDDRIVAIRQDILKSIGDR